MGDLDGDGAERSSTGLDGDAAERSSTDLAERLTAAVGAEHVLAGDHPDAAPLTRDVALGLAPGVPAFVVSPAGRDEVVAVLAAARGARAPVVARGAGTGLSGGATAVDGAVVVSFARMVAVHVDTTDHVAVAGPGVALEALDAAAAEHGLTYPIRPGEGSASLGGTVATNAGGMHAVRYGVTRTHVIGLEAVLADGTVVRTGGRIAKVSSGYDVTQLLVGSEGTLALVTEVTVRLAPRRGHRRTVLAPFDAVDDVLDAAARVVGSGLDPAVCEYLDDPTMTAISDAAGLAPVVPTEDRAPAYLLVELHDRRRDHVDDDAAELTALLADLGAARVVDLEPGTARDLIAAREQAFWAVRAAGADEVVDVVVPRSAMAAFLARARAAGDEYGGRVLGCGHAGDGNVHLAVFAPAGRVEPLVHDVLAAGVALGGAVSGEHGVGRAKAAHLAELGDPGTLAVQRRVRAALDPDGLLNPGCSVG